MRNRDQAQRRPPQDIPPVGRPRGAVWRSLQADGVVWEGQVLLVGDGVDLAARMIVTHRRVAFVRGGDLVLEVPRDWLRPEPILRRDGVLDLFVATPGSGLFDEPMTVPLRMREGHPAAGHIIAMLAPSGVRRIAPDSLSGMERAREAAPAPRFGGFWDDLDSQLDTTGAPLMELDPPANGTKPHPSDGMAEMPRDWAPIEPPDRVVRVSSTPQRHTNAAFPIAGLLPRDQRRSAWPWVFRLGALTLLLATAAALGAGKLQLPVQGGGLQPILAAPTETPAPTVTATESPVAALSPSDETALTIGVGGAAVQETTATATAAPTEPPAESTETGVAAATSPEAAIPTPAAAATPMPTPASAAGASPAALAETPAADSATPVAPFDQPPAVGVDAAPAQEIVVGPLRLAVTTAMRAESLPRYGLPPGSGEWVLLRVDITNEGEASASLAMSDFRLFDRGTGTVADLDAGVDVIASLAGLDPARAAGDVVEVEPGTTTEALLLYLLPAGSTDDLTLIVGQTSIDLAPSLALGETSPGDVPQRVAGTVTAVIDGGRVTVDVAGQEQTVQYLGMQAPTGAACFAPEATAANAALVEGQQVWLERQATDRGSDGALLRDVWISDADGNRVLVAARLVEAGAGTPLPAAPDTRYEAWLAAAAALAQTNGAGLWGACPEAPVSGNVTGRETLQLAFLSDNWDEHQGIGAR